jgi:hypothetical protein
LPVLAETALEIAAQGGNRVRSRSGKKVVQRFLLDGVDILGNEFSIGVRVKNTVLIFPDVAKTDASVMDRAKVVAEEATHRSILPFLVKKGFFQIHYHHPRVPVITILYHITDGITDGSRNTVDSGGKYGVFLIYFCGDFG